MLGQQDKRQARKGDGDIIKGGMQKIGGFQGLRAGFRAQCQSTKDQKERQARTGDSDSRGAYLDASTTAKPLLLDLLSLRICFQVSVKVWEDTEPCCWLGSDSG